MTNSTPDNGIGKKCKKCGLSVAEGVTFRIHKTNGEQSICRSCEAEIAKEYRKKNPDKIAKNKKNYRANHYGTIKHHVQEKIATWRKASDVPSDLTVDYLVSLYESQDGYCYYSGEKMIFGWVDGKVHHNSLSLDKLDPDKGYTQGNVVWCTYLVNTMKQNLTDKQFYATINKIYSTTYGVSMINELSIADKLRKITLHAKLGELPLVIEQACAEKAKLGQTSCRLHFFEGPKSLRKFYGSMGPANQEIYKDINAPFERKFSITEDEFLRQNIKDLEENTSLTIKLLEPPWWLSNNVEKPQDVVRAYFPGAGISASVVIDVSWDKTE